MKTLVLGDGPVGLATAHTLADNDVEVVHASSPFSEQSSSVGVNTRTWRAAAAFWTPFSSGLDTTREASLSQKTLRHYHDLGSTEMAEAGIQLRKIVQLWVRDEGEVPDWSSFTELEFRLVGDQHSFVYNEAYDVEFREEFEYVAPVGVPQEKLTVNRW